MTNHKRIITRIMSLTMAMMLMFGTVGTLQVLEAVDAESPPITITPFDFDAKPVFPRC